MTASSVRHSNHENATFGIEPANGPSAHRAREASTLGDELVIHEPTRQHQPTLFAVLGGKHLFFRKNQRRIFFFSKAKECFSSRPIDPLVDIGGTNTPFTHHRVGDHRLVKKLPHALNGTRRNWAYCETMRAVIIQRPGGAESLHIAELLDPVPAHGEVLISVAAAGINRADIHQREGRYPPPDGAPDWPGLEVSGTVTALGSGVSDFAVGDRVCALLAGGGYAEKVTVASGLVLPVPPSIDIEDAAALPEAIATVWSTVVMSANLRAGETLLMHGGSGGIGTMAIQLARAIGCRVAVTCSTEAKLAACRDLGADILINYKTEDFVAETLRATEGAGANVILDAVGGAYLDLNLRALASHGRIELIGNQSAQAGELNIGRLMAKWGTVRASTLRSRTLAEKVDIISSVRANAWPLVTNGLVAPIVDEKFHLEDARLAHEKMESGHHIGKILLVP